MRVAVASDDFQNVTGHAGKASRFLVFEADDGVPPREVARLDLPGDLTIHEFRCDGPHPLFQVKAVIAGSAGAGFVRRLAEHGVQAVLTTERDPATAVARWAAGTLAAAAAQCHDHGHDHDHDHGHGREGGCSCGCG
ncbi:nitrogen fixation protein [Rhodoplanes sp. TEM]|uniref:Nitrogen fixation protein n=1 Tax=Rhodoplanes tepidamans TaxID=200616 RepID=A0ABT5J8C0_RHOTP|nr:MULTISPECIES: nitrogen fixation protein [Rhodoplanes]MDC7785904.1 nitrogen fixation protein [Rhodoplanes tepidamans]MDC7985016.1 nitrogen fixation protein [Rhodoplanes sp. TEM]MDQ0355478.1 putative Fe-Mo cluster-binding NifX family protein [Rhodoplanes tepidamans]